MPPLSRRSLLLGLLLPLAACSSGGRSGTPRAARRRADLITLDEIQGRHWANVYELVSALRANWLHERGSDTLVGEPVQVQVHLDDLRLGGVDALRSTPVMGVAYIQYFDPITASARWGLGYGKGAIYISTRAR
jgi:hypothetical protein